VADKRAGKLSEYRRKRDAAKTLEPVPPAAPLPEGNDDTFVIQEHHARRLHWDLRLERDGVLVSWAVPKGIPDDPKTNHLAVHTEDHPLEYAEFAGEIPAGEYGGGRVSIWDRGRYETEKWTDREVKFVLHGNKARGRYVLFQTEGDQWMIHRMDPAADPDAEPLPQLIRPMMAAPGDLPPMAQDERYGYEMKWDGVRAVVYADRGSVRVLSRSDRDVTATYPELRGLGPELGARPAVLDGEIVAFDANGRVSFETLQPRMQIGNAGQARRLAQHTPVVFLAFDLLHMDGHPTMGLTYAERRELLESLGLNGPHWATPPYFPGNGAMALAASRDQGLEGVVAKRLDSVYEPGRRSPAWIKVKHVRSQSVVIGGWKPGQGRRVGGIGSLLLGVQGESGLEFAGHVGTGFTDRALADLGAQLRRIERRTSPFASPVPRQQARDAHWVSPKLVGEVVFAEWTRDGRMRAPSWRGLRVDIDPDEVVRES
jgi:bifunctional non-homologous end joining protein LigD